MPDLFDGTPTAPQSPAPDVVVRLIDRDPCDCGCDLAVIFPGTPPHVGELKCAECRSHRGWIAREVLALVQETISRFGVPAEPIIIQKGEKPMPEYDNTNRGALFRNDRKSGDRDPDYQGNLNVDGVEYWLSAWLKESKKGVKFMSLSIKPKNERQTNKSRRDDLADEIPF